MYEEIEERDNVKTRLRYIVHNKNLVNNDRSLRNDRSLNNYYK